MNSKVRESLPMQTSSRDESSTYGGLDLETAPGPSSRDHTLNRRRDVVFDSRFEQSSETPIEQDADPVEILQNIMKGSNEIGIPICSFLEHFKRTAYESQVTLQTAEPLSNELWKRELFAGEVPSLHQATVAAAIRLRPDLISDIFFWFDAINTGVENLITDIAPENIEREANHLITFTMKFIRFLKSQVPTMTIVLGGKIRQIRKKRHFDGKFRYVSHTIGSRTASWHVQGLGHSRFHGKKFTSTLLIRGNQVVAIGAEDTVDQIFDRQYLGKILITEMVCQPVAFDLNNVETRNDIPNPSEVHGFRPESVQVDETVVQLKKVLYEIITNAVSHLCSDGRSLMTAHITITEDRVQFSERSPNFDSAIKINPGLLEEPTFCDFVTEIEMLEQEAEKVIEETIFAKSLSHLDLSTESLNDPLAQKMTHLLVAGMKKQLGLEQETNIGKIWDKLQNAREGSAIFLRAAVEQYNSKKNCALKLGVNIR